MPPIISRGFRGRRDDVPSDRVPPGQYVTSDFPVLSAGPTPHTPLEQWDFSIVGEVDEPRRWTWEEFRALPSEEVTVDIHCVTKWSKLDTVWQGVSRRHAARRRRDRRRSTSSSSATAATRPTCRSRTSRAARRGSRSATTASRSSRSTAARRACSCRTSTSGRARSGCAGCGCRRRTSPASGRSTATTTTATHGGSSGTGATDLAARGRRRRRHRDASRQDDRVRRPGLARTPRRPARRRPPDRRGRLPGAAQLLDRVGAGRHPHRADRRAPRRRRGLALPDRRAPARATRSSCVAPSAATSSGSRHRAGRCCSSPAARASCR